MFENQALDQLIREKYPFPISHTYGYLESRIEPEDRYQALLACFEVTLKTITAIAVANFMHDVQENPDIGNVNMFRDLLEILGRPLSLGHWNKLLQLTLRPYAAYREYLIMPELFDFYFRVTDSGKVKSQSQRVQLIQRFIQERNEEAHHRNRSQTSTLQRQAELAPLEKDMGVLLADLRFLADYPWLYVENAQHHDGQWHYRANYACGNNHPFRQQTWRTTLGVNSRRCLVVNEAAPALLELYPFTIITAEGRLQQPDIFFFDGIFSSGRANFMNYHIGDYIDPKDAVSPASVASDAIMSLLRFLENRIPKVVEEAEADVETQLSAVDIYRDAAEWALENETRQSVTLEALRQILGLPREEALKQERESETAHGVQVEPEELEVPFEGKPGWANLAYYILDNSGQDEMFYKDIAPEAEELKDQYDPNWQKGDASNVPGTINYVMSTDPRFYRSRRSHYRLTKNNELLSNPSWANLACFVLKRDDPQYKGMHLNEISTRAIKLKKKYGDWRSEGSRTPQNTVSATMSTDHRFEPLPERGYWRLVPPVGESRPSEPEPTPDVAESGTRRQAYEQVQSRLEELGKITPLPFGRTYYALDGTIHLMFRYSKSHQRNDEIEYFLGVTPQYYERIDDLGHGYLVFVLGQADNVLLVPTETFATWVENTGISGSGTWPIAFYQSEDGTRLERWVSGSGREDVTAYLNDYDSLRRILNHTSPTTMHRSKKPIRISDLLKAGLLTRGDVIHTRKVPDAKATVVDAKYVEYNGQRWHYNDWGTHVTGWMAINIYAEVVLARTGQTLDDLRRQLREG